MCTRIRYINVIPNGIHACIGDPYMRTRQLYIYIRMYVDKVGKRTQQLQKITNEKNGGSRSRYACIGVWRAHHQFG